MESNDSPEIPDRGETSDIPGLPSGKERKRGKGVRERDREKEKRESGGEGVCLWFFDDSRCLNHILFTDSCSLQRSSQCPRKIHWTACGTVELFL